MSNNDYYIQGSLFAEYRRVNRSAVRPELAEKYRSKIEALQHVISKLRNEDLNRGYCFLIFDNNLPEDQAYYEYPDGLIRIEQLDPRNIEIPRTVLKVLSKAESKAVRKKHALAV